MTVNNSGFSIPFIISTFEKQSQNQRNWLFTIHMGDLSVPRFGLASKIHNW